MKINVIIALTVALLLIFTNYSVFDSDNIKTAQNNLTSSLSEDKEETSANNTQADSAEKPSEKAPKQALNRRPQAQIPRLQAQIPRPQAQRRHPQVTARLKRNTPQGRLQRYISFLLNTALSCPKWRTKAIMTAQAAKLCPIGFISRRITAPQKSILSFFGFTAQVNAEAIIIPKFSIFPKPLW